MREIFRYDSKLAVEKPYAIIRFDVFSSNRIITARKARSLPTGNFSLRYTRIGLAALENTGGETLVQDVKIIP